MTGSYDPNFVVLSVAIAIIASYTALDLSGRVSSSSGKKSWGWLAAGAVSMGTGIWSMHFIGMLAFHLPIPVVYDLPITLLSMVIAIVVSGFALYMMRRHVLNASKLCGELGKTAHAAVIGKKVLQELSRPFRIEGNELDISCSIGISIYPQDGRDVSTLVANADAAMYQAKKSGRNDYRFFGFEVALPYVEGVR